MSKTKWVSLSAARSDIHARVSILRMTMCVVCRSGIPTYRELKSMIRCRALRRGPGATSSPSRFPLPRRHFPRGAVCDAMATVRPPSRGSRQQSRVEFGRVLSSFLEGRIRVVAQRDLSNAFAAEDAVLPSDTVREESAAARWMLITESFACARPRGVVALCEIERDVPLNVASPRGLVATALDRRVLAHRHRQPSEPCGYSAVVVNAGALAATGPFRVCRLVRRFH